MPIFAQFVVIRTVYKGMCSHTLKKIVKRCMEEENFNAHFDKILFLYLLIFVFLFLLNSVFFLFDSSFERGSLRVMCPLRPEENFKIYLSNGAIWYAFVTKYLLMLLCRQRKINCTSILLRPETHVKISLQQIVKKLKFSTNLSIMISIYC